MRGPFPLGSWEKYAADMGLAIPKVHRWAPGSPKMVKLIRGRRYRVEREFIDADGDTHGAGEEWEFIMCTFDRQYSLFALYVRSASGAEWEISIEGVREDILYANAGFLVRTR